MHADKKSITSKDKLTIPPTRKPHTPVHIPANKREKNTLYAWKQGEYNNREETKGFT